VYNSEIKNLFQMIFRNPFVKTLIKLDSSSSTFSRLPVKVGNNIPSMQRFNSTSSCTFICTPSLRELFSPISFTVGRSVDGRSMDCLTINQAIPNMENRVHRPSKEDVWSLDVNHRLCTENFLMPQSINFDQIRKEAPFITGKASFFNTRNIEYKLM